MLIDRLYGHAASRGGHPAVLFGDEEVSYAEFVERVERLAAGLDAVGIRARDAVALLLPNSTDYVVSFFAIAGLGAVVVPLNPQFKQEELGFYFRNCGVRAVIADEKGAAVAQRIVDGWAERVAVVTTGPPEKGALSFDSLASDHAPRALDSRSPDEDIVFQFSSGSTGRPKRVARTHGQCAAEGHSYTKALGITPEDRIFCPIPLFHTYGQGMCVLTIADSGATLVLLEEPNPFVLRRQRALELLERHRATIFAGVPLNYRLLAEAPGEPDVSSLEWCYSAGTALTRAAFDAFRDKYGIAVRQLYGCTEAGLMTINVDPDPVATFECVGTPAEGVRVTVVDDEGHVLAGRQSGEIRITGPALTRGYADMEELNRQAFRDGWYFTGDIGRVDDEGRVFITGRKKLFIEVAGHKVDPIEVEDVLAAHPKVREAVVVGVKGRVDGEDVVKAAVVPSDECAEREVIEFCQQRLANFKVPQIVEFREEIPKSPLGKILRKYLVEGPEA